MRLSFLKNDTLGNVQRPLNVTQTSNDTILAYLNSINAMVRNMHFVHFVSLLLLVCIRGLVLTNVIIFLLHYMYNMYNTAAHSKRHEIYVCGCRPLVLSRTIYSATGVFVLYRLQQFA